MKNPLLAWLEKCRVSGVGLSTTAKGISQADILQTHAQGDVIGISINGDSPVNAPLLVLHSDNKGSTVGSRLRDALQQGGNLIVIGGDAVGADEFALVHAGSPLGLERLGDYISKCARAAAWGQCWILRQQEACPS